MHRDPDSYVKASDYDLAKQGHNHRVFIRFLRRHHGIAAMLGALFAALAFAALAMPAATSGAVTQPWRPWALACVSIAVAIYLVIAAFRPDSPA